MVEVSGGGYALYIYASTRMRVRKAKLLPREEYLRMLNMSLPELTRFIGETEYKTEIDELGGSFTGIDLMEVALSWNLAKEYQKVLSIAPGVLRQFTASYLRRWDIQNVLTILRGKKQGLPAGSIKEVLIPAGSLDTAVLDRLLNEDSADRIVEALKGRRLYPVLERELPLSVELGTYAHMENELYKQFYAELISEAKSGVRGGHVFLSYLKLEIDIRNVRTLFRLRESRGEHDHAADLMIPDGSFSVDELVRFTGATSTDELVDSVKKRVGLEAVAELLESLRGDTRLHEIEIGLTRVMLEQMEKMSMRYPFSVCPILVYLEKKKYEVENIRALARGKEYNLPPEKIQGYLVV